MMPGITLLRVLASAVLASCAVLLVPPQASAQVASVDGSFTLTLDLAVPPPVSAEATRGAWACSARALGKPAADAELAKIVALGATAAREEFASFLEYRAHYLGQQARSEFVVTAGQPGPAAPVTIVIGRDDLVDPVSHRALAQPAVLAGCWLQLSNAAGQGGFVLQSGKGSLLQTSGRPFLLASAEVPNG